MDLNLKNLENARNVSTVVTIVFLLISFIFLSFFSTKNNNRAGDDLPDNIVQEELEPNISTTTQANEIATPSNPFVIQYVVEFSGDSVINPSVQLWYTKNVAGDNEITSVRLQRGQPFTKTLQFTERIPVQFSAIVKSGSGPITCKILQDGTIIEQIVKEGPSPQVNCSSFISSSK